MVEGCSYKQGQGGLQGLGHRVAGLPLHQAIGLARPSSGRATASFAHPVDRRPSPRSGVMDNGFMKLSELHRVILSACIALLASPPATGAEIYKWIDAAGRTHYSENKKEAEAANAITLNVKVPSPSSDPRPSRSSRSQEAPARPHQGAGPYPKPFHPPTFEKPKQASAGQDETASGKCSLARNILNGSARHSNMKPTDAYDRQVAESDVRIFCK